MGRRRSMPANTWAQQQGKGRYPTRAPRFSAPTVPRFTMPRWARPAWLRMPSPRWRPSGRAVWIGVAAVAVIALGVGVTMLAVGGGDGGQPSGATQAAGGAAGGDSSSSMAQVSQASGETGVLACPEITRPDLRQSRGSGDRTSAQGLIIAYEHAFFVRRDPAAMVAMTTPGPQVVGEQALAKGLAQIPVGTEWCVAIGASVKPNVYPVTIRFVQSDGRTVGTWTQEMTVVKQSPTASNSWTITAVVSTP